jgi:hypothetical protein
MTNVKVFADKQTYRRTGQKLYAPDLLIRGHKKTLKNPLSSLIIRYIRRYGQVRKTAKYRSKHNLLYTFLLITISFK